MNAAAGTAGSIPDLAARLIEHHSVEQITMALETMIAVLDYLDGDPEAEETGLEDGFEDHAADGPGCPIADGPGDVSWSEWHTRGRRKLAGSIRTGAHEPIAASLNGWPLHEDDEDDDPAEDDDESGQRDEDGVNTGDNSKEGPGCVISDPIEHDCRSLDLVR